MEVAAPIGPPTSVARQVAAVAAASAVAADIAVAATGDPFEP